MKLSVFAPVKNEAPWIGYSIMAVLDHVHEFLYACAPSTDGTDILLDHIKRKYAKNKLKIFRDSYFDFDVKDTKAYNAAFNYCIDHSEGDALFFLHPDMVVTNAEQIAKIPEGPLAWWTNIKSFAGDHKTLIAKGRASRWKNIHAKQFGLHYYGAYGSQNEDMYHADITGDSYRHFGEVFKAYPYKVADSGLQINHYCEVKGYKRRLEKMKACLKTQNPSWTDELVDEMAAQHPRVTLENSVDKFGRFEFVKVDDPIPEVFTKYQEEFNRVLGRKKNEG